MAVGMRYNSRSPFRRLQNPKTDRLLENDRLTPSCERNPGNPVRATFYLFVTTKIPVCTRSHRLQIEPLDIQSYLPTGTFRMVVLPMPFHGKGLWPASWTVLLQVPVVDGRVPQPRRSIPGFWNLSKSRSSGNRRETTVSRRACAWPGCNSADNFQTSTLIGNARPLPGLYSVLATAKMEPSMASPNWART